MDDYFNMHYLLSWSLFINYVDPGKENELFFSVELFPMLLIVLLAIWITSSNGNKYVVQSFPLLYKPIISNVRNTEISASS
jgi:hypothetical protein